MKNKNTLSEYLDGWLDIFYERHESQKDVNQEIGDNRSEAQQAWERIKAILTRLDDSKLVEKYVIELAEFFEYGGSAEEIIQSLISEIKGMNAENDEYIGTFPGIGAVKLKK